MGDSSTKWPLRACLVAVGLVIITSGSLVFRARDNSYGQTLTRATTSTGAQALALPAHGVVRPFAIPPVVSHFPARVGEVYLPRIWFEVPHPRLPVIELLHGSPGSPSDWIQRDWANVTADRYANLHGGVAPIIVMPDVNGRDWWHDTECVNGPMGNAEKYLTVDVRNAMVQSFGVRRQRSDWSIGGLSEGGSCALQIGLRHPGMFAAVGDFSGDDHPWVQGGPAKLFRGSTLLQLARAERAYDPRVLLAHWSGSSAPFLALASGRGDTRLAANMVRLRGQARLDHIEAAVFIRAGAHSFRFWRRAFVWALPLMMQHMDRPAIALP